MNECKQMETTKTCSNYIVAGFDACRGGTNFRECDTPEEAMALAENLARSSRGEVGVYVRAVTAAVPVEFTIEIGE